MDIRYLDETEWEWWKQIDLWVSIREDKIEPDWNWDWWEVDDSVEYLWKWNLQEHKYKHQW